MAAVRRTGGTAEGCVLDVTDAGAGYQWAEATADRPGGVHMIWNVAGVINAGDVPASSLADIQRLLAVDFWGVVHGTKAFLPHVIASGDGRVVNVSSAFGLLSAPAYGGYNAAKFAVRGWTDALRQEMRLAGHPVSVTCVYPGEVRTPIMDNSTSAAGAEDARRRRETFNTRVARTEPDRAAALILRGVAARRPRVLVCADAHLADLLARITATGYERWLPAAQQLISKAKGSHG